jgi:hypothetical protein
MSKFFDALVQMGFTRYAEYLDSPIWADFKRRYREAGLPIVCAICGSKRYQLHHHDYARLGNESFGDVTPLCKDHHDQVHACLLEMKWAVTETKVAMDLIRSGQVFDLERLLNRRKGSSVPKKAKAKKKPNVEPIKQPVKPTPVSVLPAMVEKLLAQRGSVANNIVRRARGAIKCGDKKAMAFWIDALTNWSDGQLKEAVPNRGKKNKAKRKRFVKENREKAARVQTAKTRDSSTDAERELRMIAAGVRRRFIAR